MDPPDPDEARDWYTKAAEAGHGGARFKLRLLLAAQLDKPRLADTHTSWTGPKHADARDHR